MTANQTHPPEKQKEPGFIERAINGLEDHFARGERGDHTGYERPEVEEEEKIDPTKLGAEGFQHLVEEHDQEKKQQRDKQREAIADQCVERVEELKEQHVSGDRWAELMRRACESAKAGETEFLLLRFPSQLCSDGGRAINVSEEGWPETLRGEARELYDRWKNDLKPQGFRLTAKILDFPDGVPGDAGLYLSWGG
jgi:hypothetical protein